MKMQNGYAAIGFLLLLASTKVGLCASGSEDFMSDPLKIPPETLWAPPDGNAGHEWQVDLGKPHEISGAKIVVQVDGR